MSETPHQPQRGPDRSGYLSEDTIAAAATAIGGAVAIVRISGPEAFDALERMTDRGFLQGKSSRSFYRATLRASDQQPIDDALVVFFASPRSYTGENCVELHVHGGSFTTTRLLEELALMGVRQALPGEFSFRAVRNGKMAVSQAQAVADLIGASNDGAVALALEKMSGTQNRLLQEIAVQLRQLAMLGEIGIDFSDQDVDEVSLPNLRKKISGLTDRLQRLRGSYARGSRLQDGVSVAFIGLPNAGKSSFFNALLGEDRSIVSEIAGTTRDVVRERLTLRGREGSVSLRLEDTAGLRNAEDVIERMGIERSHKAARDADLLLLVVDAGSDEAALELLEQQWKQVGRPDAKSLGILTKCDLHAAPTIEALQTRLKVFGKIQWHETSAVTGEGISEAADRIIEFCSRWTRRDRGEVLLTHLDQVNAVSEAIDHLERALEAPEIDLFASDVKHALRALGPLIGETLPDDILGQIFSKFCIGK